MNRPDFHIGLEFWTGAGRWRCTDVGTRVITAIRVDSVNLVRSEAGVQTPYTLTGEEAEAQDWFNGPPYVVAEMVFDEYDMEGCLLDPDEFGA